MGFEGQAFTGGISCEKPLTDNSGGNSDDIYVEHQFSSDSDGNRNQGSGSQYYRMNNGSPSDLVRSIPIELTVNQLPTRTTGSGSSRGGSRTVTFSEFEEHTISEANQFLTSEAWSTATTIDTTHAADLQFTFRVRNLGTDYAREISSLLFNIYIGNEPEPIVTYNVIQQIGAIQNQFPGEGLTITSDPIPLTLEQTQLIDEGAQIFVSLADVAFGQDQAFYQDALNSSILFLIEDGVADLDSNIDSYLIPVWSPSDTVQDILKRYFPIIEDDTGRPTSIFTPEFGSNPPIFNEYALDDTTWWNIFLSEKPTNTESIFANVAKPGTSTLLRFYSDQDNDGYNDRSEVRLKTDQTNPDLHPNPELLAGYTTDCVGNECMALISFLNIGNYDAYGIEVVMYSPDGLSEITNNIIGGNGRVPAGQQVVLGTRILQPNMTGWTGGAEPYSTGYYLGDVDRTLTFTATGAGNIGAGTLEFDWRDDQGDGGTVDFGASYQAPLPVNIVQGIQLGFQTGGVNVGESFTVQALTPRDTFQYTISSTNAISPVIVVSYNDPQGNHRFILPGGAYPAGSELTDLNTDLSPLSGLMLPDPGVTIAATGEGQAHFILNSPHPESISDSHLFVEYIDSTGNVDREDVFTQTLETGPTIIPLTVDTGVYTPSEYILLAFFTDSQGNIIDSSARPLASFGADPLPVANLVAGQWEVGLQAVSVIPDPWNFGTVEAGTLLSARLTLANSGLASLQYSLNGLGNGLSLAGPSSGVLAPADTRRLSFALDTAGLPGGPFTRTVTLRTNDPNAAVVAINLAGTIQPGVGAGLAHQVNPFRPWDQYVSVPGPRNVNEAITFTHTISDAAVSMQPLYLYSEDGQILRGIGEFGIDVSGQSIPINAFGTGADGDLIVGPTGNCGGTTCFTDDARTPVSSSIGEGQNQITVDSVSGLSLGDEVLIIQMQGTGAGNYDFGLISNISGNIITLVSPLANAYTVGGNSRAQLVRVPNYQDVTVQSGGTLTARAWNGSTGGVLAFRALGTTNVQAGATVNLSGNGFRGGPAPNVNSPGGLPGFSGIPGESYTGISTAGNIVNGNEVPPNAGGGGGARAAANGNGVQLYIGGGGGSFGGNGTEGDPSGSNAGGDGGSLYSARLLPGSGGGSGSSFSEVAGRPGGNGGGVVYIGTRQLAVAGLIENDGNGGASTPDPYGGAGGGGSGGAIFLQCDVCSLGDFVDHGRGWIGRHHVEWNKWR